MYAGQVLACEYEKIFMDVSAPTKSGGFMDAHNLPPIDTWFYCTRKENTPMLFAWIPEPFVAAVQNVIDQSDFHDLSWFSNPENNISDFY